MGEYPMSIVKTTNRKTTNVPKFSIRLNKDDSVEFRPTSTFAHINVEQVLQFCQYGKCHLYRHFDNIKHDMIRK